MSAEKTIRNLIGWFPSMFHSRTQVLVYLFLKRGNGYKWKEGKLTAIYDPDVEIPYKIPEEAAAIIAKYTVELPIDEMPRWDSKCMLALAPRNMYPDWKAVVAEMETYLEEAGYKKNPDDYL